MPTVEQKLEEFRGSGRYDSAREHFYEDTGVDFEALPKNAEWSEVLSRAKAIRQARDIVKPAVDLVGTVTAGQEIPRNLKAMQKIGESLSPTKKPSRRTPFVKPGVMRTEFPDATSPLEGPTDVAISALGGAVSGMAEAGMSYAGRMAPAMMLLMGQSPSSVMFDPAVSKFSKQETPGEKYLHKIINPALELPGYERAWEGAKGVAGGTQMLARALVGMGTERERQEVGRALGEGMTSGLAGSAEALVRWPEKAIPAQPVETGMAVMGPLSRAAGAGARALGMTAKSGKLSKGLGVVGDLLDPQPGTRRVFNQDIASEQLSPEQARLHHKYTEMENSGMLPSGTADRWAESQKQLSAAKTAKKATEATTASKVGSGIRRAAAGALLGGDILGGGAGGMLAAGGMSAAAPAAFRLATSRMSDKSRNRARQVFVDPNAMPDPQSEAVVAETTSRPLREGLAIHDMGVEAAAKAETAPLRQQMVDSPLEYGRETFVARPGSTAFERPPATVGHRLALDEGRMREAAAASGEPVAARGYAQQAKQKSKTLTEMEGAPNYYQLSKRYVREREAARVARAAESESAARVQALREADPAAFDFEQARIAEASAREDYIRARGVASMEQLAQEATLAGNPALAKRYLDARAAYTEFKNKARETIEGATPSVDAYDIAMQQAKVSALKKGVSQSGLNPNRKRVLSAILDEEQAELSRLTAQAEQAGIDKARIAEAVALRKKAWKKYDEVKKSADGALDGIEREAIDIFEKGRERNIAAADLQQRRDIVSSLPDEDAKRVRKGATKVGAALAAADRRAADAASAEAKAAGLGAKIPEGDFRAQGVLEGVERSVEAKRAGKKAAAALEEFPPTERAAKIAAGQIDLIGKVFDPRNKDGAPLTGKRGLFLDRVEITNTVKATADLVRKADPKSALANPEYVGQLLATIWQRRALVGSFSKRARGYVSKAITKQMVDTLGLDTVRSILEGRGLDAAKWGEKRLKREMNSVLEQEIVKRSSEAIIGGRPTELRFAFERPDGSTVVLDSGTLVSKFLADPSRSMADRRAIANEAVSGVFDTIKSHYIRDETQSSIAREAIRSANPDRASVDSISNGFAALEAATDPNAVKPNILLFDPNDFAAQMSNPKSVVANARRWLGDGSSPDADIIQRVKSAARFYSREFEPADPDVVTALRAGMNKMDRQLPEGAPVYVRKGYNEAVGTHLRFTQTMSAATSLALDMANFGKVFALAGSTSTQVANMFSNVTAISLAMGENPYKVMAGIAKEFHTLWTQVERGTLTGPEAVKYRAIMRSGIADSSMLNERFGNMFRGDSSKGFVRSAAETAVGIRKEIYKQGDTGPKLFLTSRSFDGIHSAIERLEPGRTIEMPLGKGAYAKIRRRADGKFEVGSKTYSLSDQEFADLIARSASKFAGDILFDFNDMPGFIKSMAASRNVPFTVFNPYAAWAFKAAELPGKPGLVGNMLGFDPTWGLKTDSPTLMRERAAKFGKLAIRRKVQSEGFRQIANLYQSEGLNSALGFDGATDAMLVNPYSEDMQVVDALDQSSGMPTVQADAALRLLHWGGVAGVSAVGSLFGRSPQDYADMERSKDPNERAVGKLYRMHAGDNIAGPKELAAYFSLTGGMFRQVLKMIEDKRYVVSGVQAMMRMMMGGDIQSLVNASIEKAAPNTSLTTRRYMPEAERKENFSKWWFNSLFRLSFREKDLNGELDRWVTKRKTAIRSSYIKPLEDKEKIAFSELRRTRRGTPEYEEKRLELAAIRKELILTERALNQVADRFERDADKARRIWRKKVRSNKVRRLKSGPPPNMREAQEAASQTQGLMPTAPIQ